MYKLSLFIAGYNEIEHLQHVLPFYVKYIDDVNYFDLESTDGSAEYAKTLYNCKVHTVPKEQTIEILHHKYANHCKNEWIIYADPDERWTIDLLNEINKATQIETIGMVSAPINFYFKGTKLLGTRWGGNKVRGVAFHRDRIQITDNVHKSKKINPRYQNFHINCNNCTIRHYWMNTYTDLIEKHRRYLLHEGKSRFQNGQRIKTHQLLTIPVVSFFESFYKKKGYRDGLIGLVLSIFWSWYNSTAMLELYKYQQAYYKGKI